MPASSALPYALPSTTTTERAVDRATLALAGLGALAFPALMATAGPLHPLAGLLLLLGLAAVGLSRRPHPDGWRRSGLLGAGTHMIAWALSVQAQAQTELSVLSGVLFTMQIAYGDVRVLAPSLLLMLVEHVVALAAFVPASPSPWLPAPAPSATLLLLSLALKVTHALAAIGVTRLVEQRSRAAATAARALTDRAAAADARARAVLEADAILNGLVESAEDGIAVMDQMGQVLLWNPSQAAGTGIPGDRALGEPHDQLLGEDPERVAALAAALRGEHTYLTGLPLPGPAGTRVADVTYLPLRTSDGRIAGAVCVTHDVSAREQAAAELAAARQQLAEAIEAINAGFALYDDQDRLLSANRAYREIYAEIEDMLVPGTSFEAILREYLRRNPERVIDGDMEGTVRERLRVRRAGEERSEIRYGDRWLQMEDRPTSSGGRVSLRTDITDLKRIQEDLEQARSRAETANRAKSDFLARMSHELRTPLNSIIGFSKVVAANKHGGLTERDLGYLQRVSQNGEHLLSLINDILDLAKVEAGKMGVLVAPVDCAALVHDLVHMLEPQAAPGVQLLAVLPRGSATIASDEVKLQQILINLVGNALKFTRAGSVSVIVSAAGEDGMVDITVRDTGIGIPPDRLSAIFDAFEQADGTTSRQYGGTGLGLAITRALCDLINAELTVESTVGHGTSFRLRCRALAPAAVA